MGKQTGLTQSSLQAIFLAGQTRLRSHCAFHALSNKQMNKENVIFTFNQNNV